MPTCRQCLTTFPNRVKINGVTKILSSRKYCLACSPFGANNRRRLEATPTGSRPCVDCGKLITKKFRCNTCVSRRRRANLRERLFALSTDTCEGCGYGGSKKYHPILTHHHQDPATKSFGLTVTNISERSWADVVEEVRKCVVLCPTCHAEVHAGLRDSNTLMAYPRG